MPHKRCSEERNDREREEQGERHRDERYKEQHRGRDGAARDEHVPGNERDYETNPEDGFSHRLLQVLLIAHPRE